ncbi:MAG: lipid A deacylase LpxR family protein [Deltaproteobacteria bacterium]|nr:lipid A deacylase LpxR family protein [Deltaproteobacteria bacterium]
MKRIFYFTVILLFLIPSWGQSAEGTPSDSGAFSFYLENDAVAGTDRDYTSGMKLSWTSRWIPALETESDDPKKKGWVSSTLKRLPFFNQPGDRRALSILIGQSIYTPEDLERSDLITDDRPYAGYTYLGFAVHQTAQKTMDTLELDIGIVGPHSYAEDVQDGFHQWFGYEGPKGWKNQLKDEFALELIYERKWKLWASKLGYGFGYDFIPHLGGRFGNVNISVNTGAELRFGWNPPGDFGTCPIRPGCESNGATNLGDNRRPSFGIHAFLSLDGRAVLRDIFLDGNTWEESHSVDKKYFVADLGAGLGISTKLFKLTYGIIYRTKEFESQKSDGQLFGTLLITFYL